MSNENGTRRGLLVILSSPSGAGKSTLARRLIAWDPSMTFSVSATTRAMRPGEVEGRDYYFKDKAGFMALADRGEMLEWAHVFGHLYGSPLAPVRAHVDAGRDVIFDVDWQGGQQIRASRLKDNTVSIFILPPTIADLEARLRARGQDSSDVIAGRMERSMDEISHWDAYDYVLINDDLDACELALRSILTTERLRRDRQLHLMPHVKALGEEFEERRT